MGGATASFMLDIHERGQLARDGFIVRERAFSAAECQVIAADCERLLGNLVAAKRGETGPDPDVTEALRDAAVFVKWERDAPDVVQGIEPFAHLSKPLHDWGMDRRLVDPARAVVGADELVLFTEKLNVKRAKKGGPIVLHQDYPYWEQVSPIAHQVATAMVFLDDASVENGCLEVAPGSHTSGKFKQRRADGVGGKEMDPDAFDLSRLVPLEVPAGSIAFFGAFLVHRSLPNRSAYDRRALLYSYQPKGNPHGRELHHALNRRLGAAIAVHT